MTTAPTHLAAQPGAGARGGAGASARPITAEAYRVEPARIAETIPAQGTLLAAEQVDIVSELNRRLVKIHVDEGAEVKRGDLLMKLDDRDLLAELERLAVRRRLAEVNEARLRDAFNSQAAAKSQYDEAVNAVQLIEAEDRILRVELEKTEIRAPFDGVLGRRMVSEGAWVTSSMVLTTLYALDEVEVQFSVPERYGPSLKKGMGFSFRPPGLSHDETGRITLVEPKIDAATRSVVVIGRVDNRDRELRPGGFVTVDLKLDELEGGLMVPTQAVVPTLRGHSVFVFANGKAAEREIRLGVRTPTQVQVLDGLQAGEIVLTTNLLRLRPGIAVELREAGSSVAAAAPKGS